MLSSPDNKNGRLEPPPDVRPVLVGLHRYHGPVVDALSREPVSHQRHVLVDAARADAWKHDQCLMCAN